MDSNVKCGRCGTELSRAIQPSSGPFDFDFGIPLRCHNCGARNWTIGDSIAADLKLGCLHDLPRSYATVIPANGELSEVWQSFTQNMDRVLALGRMPSLFLFHFQIYLRARDAPPGGHMTIELKDDHGEVLASVPSMTWTTDSESIDLWFANVRNRGTFLALEGLLSSMIVGTWTAFETLAGDLWEAALNCHPRVLSALDGEPAGWQNGNSSQDDEAKSGGGKSGEKAIALGLLQRHNHNLSRVMGEILRYRFSFQTLPVIRKAYGQAFRSDFDAVRDALVHTSLDHLAGLRNVLVHRAGKADQKFKAQTQDCAHFSGIAVGNEIKLNGEIVADVIGKAAKQATSLFTAIECWIRDHPESTDG